MLRPRCSIKMHRVLGLSAASLQSPCKTKWLLKLGWGWHYVRSNAKIAKSLFPQKCRIPYSENTEQMLLQDEQVHAPKILWEDCENLQDAELMQHYLYLCYHCIVHINSFRHVCQSHVKFPGKVARRPCCDNKEVILDMLPVLQGDLLCVHVNICDCPLLETFSECWFVRDEGLCCITCKINVIIILEYWNQLK